MVCAADGERGDRALAPKARLERVSAGGWDLSSSSLLATGLWVSLSAQVCPACPSRPSSGGQGCCATHVQLRPLRVAPRSIPDPIATSCTAPQPRPQFSTLSRGRFPLGMGTWMSVPTGAASALQAPLPTPNKREPIAPGEPGPQVAANRASSSTQGPGSKSAQRRTRAAIFGRSHR